MPTNNSINNAQPSHVLYVAENGTATGSGTFYDPISLPRLAAVKANSLGVSSSNNYVIKVMSGTYTDNNQTINLYPGLFLEFEEGVRYTASNGYIRLAGWSGILGATCGVKGFAPLDFASPDIRFPSDSIGLVYFTDCNLNAQTDVWYVNTAHPTINSQAIFSNCDGQIASTQEVDTTITNCRFNTFAATAGHFDMTVNIFGGTSILNYNGVCEDVAAANISLNTIVYSGFLTAVTMETDRPTGTATLTAPQGSYGTIALTASGGGTLPTVVTVTNSGAETADADLVSKDWSVFISNDLATNPRLKLKFKSGSNVASVYLGTKELFVPITVAVTNTMANPGATNFLAAQVDNSPKSANIGAQIPFDGASVIRDILVEGFVTGMSVTGATIATAVSWAALGELWSTNSHSANYTLSPAADNTLIRFSILSAFTSGSTALTVGDLIGVTLSTTTAAKVLYVTGLVILYT